MTYYPNREKDVVLACGCIASGWLQVHVFGENKSIIGCDKHPDGIEKWGCQRILREASIHERVRFFEYGIPAPKRRSSKPPDWLRTMSGKP